MFVLFTHRIRICTDAVLLNKLMTYKNMSETGTQFFEPQLVMLAIVSFML